MTSLTSTLIHGVFLNIFGVGTLVTGESGSGKSELALALINRGHQLIADDIVEFFLNPDNTLTGSSPPALKNLLEIRGVGIFNLLELFGSSAIRAEQILALNIELKDLSPITRVTGNPTIASKPILNIPVPHMILPAGKQRRSEILVEALVLHYKLQQCDAPLAMPHRGVTVNRVHPL